MILPNLIDLLFATNIILNSSFLQTPTCSSGEYPSDTNDDEDDVDRFCVGENRISKEDSLSFCSRLVDGPLSRVQALKVASRMVELLQRPRSRIVGCRISPSLNLAAQRLVEFITQESYVFSEDDDMPPEPKRRETADEDWCELYSMPTQRRNCSANTMKKIIDLVDKGASPKTIQAKYPWFKPYMLKGMRKCASGDSRLQNLGRINDFVLGKVEDARKRFLPIHDYNIIDWGLEISRRLNMTHYFKASRTWLLNFKKRNGIVARTITEYASAAERRQEERIANETFQFKYEYILAESQFSRKLIWNMDQTGFNYEIVNKRTLSWRGERDTIVNIDQKNRMTHSYTSQPIISRYGQPIGKLLLCLKEDSGKFGPEIAKRVKELETKLGNVRVYASSSGKMSKELMLNWIEDVLRPAIEDAHMGGDDETEIYNYDLYPLITLDDFSREESNSSILLLLDQWTGQINDEVIFALEDEGVDVKIFPAHTTSELQPLDVTFNRQYKKFVKRVMERAIYENMTQQITNREGTILLHSMIWYEFKASAYRDMFRYAWRKVDDGYVDNELESGPPPKLVQDIQFDFDRSNNCSYSGCTHRPLVQCSHTGKFACLTHFMRGQCRVNAKEMDLTNEYANIDS